MLRLWTPNSQSAKRLAVLAACGPHDVLPNIISAMANSSVFSDSRSPQYLDIAVSKQKRGTVTGMLAN